MSWCGIPVGGIERATVAGAGPPEVIELGDWLVPFGEVDIDRGRAAVPLLHEGVGAPDVAGIEEAYLARGLVPRFRLPGPLVDGLGADLVDRGYALGRGNHVMAARRDEILAACHAGGTGPAGEISTATPEWRGAADVADDRIDAMVRAGSRFVAARIDGAIAGVAGVYVGDDAVVVNAVHTVPAYRRRGVAQRLLRAAVAVAAEAGIDTLCLQVAADNSAAVACYRRAGMAVAWDYRYAVGSVSSDRGSGVPRLGFA